MAIIQVKHCHCRMRFQTISVWLDDWLCQKVSSLQKLHFLMTIRLLSFLLPKFSACRQSISYMPLYGAFKSSWSIFISRCLRTPLSLLKLFVFHRQPTIMKASNLNSPFKNLNYLSTNGNLTIIPNRKPRENAALNCNEFRFVLPKSTACEWIWCWRGKLIFFMDDSKTHKDFIYFARFQGCKEDNQGKT